MNSTIHWMLACTVLPSQSANPNRSDADDLLEDESMIIAAYSKFYVSIALSVCCAIGFYGNTMSILIFLHADMRSPINSLLAAVSIIDLIQLLLIVPILILPGLNMILEESRLIYAYNLTVLYLYPFGMMSQTAGMWIYVLIGVERYVAVCKPLKSYKLLTNRQAKCALFVICLVAVLYNMVRFWEYRWDDSEEILPFLRSDRFYFLFYFTSLHLITHFLLPISSILILHACIILNLKHARDNRVSLRYSNGSAGNSERRQKSTTLMILMTTGVFLSCHIAPFSVNLWETFDRNVFRSTFVDVVSDASNFLLAAHAACSFLIYMKFCRQYRHLFLRLMRMPTSAASDSDQTATTTLRSKRPRWGVVKRSTSAGPHFTDTNSDLMVTSFRTRTTSDMGYLQKNVNAVQIPTI